MPRLQTLLFAGLVTCGIAAPATAAPDDPPAPADATHPWAVHDLTRPLPPKVDPGPASAEPAPIPADAVVLFDGTDPDADLSAFTSAGEPWPVRDGTFAVPKGGKWLSSNEAFGDVHLHLEWKILSKNAKGKPQIKGNSGVYLMGKYEIQIYEGAVYADGMAGAVYGQNPPLVNASRGMDHWQTYDLFFRAPRFDAGGNLESPATVTVIHNGLLVQDRWVLEGPTRHKFRTQYKAHDPELPFGIQDHGGEVHFRSVWARRLGARPVSPAEGL